MQALRDPARGGHGQEQLRVREERPGLRRDRGARGRPQGRGRGVRGQRRNLRLQARARPSWTARRHAAELAGIDLARRRDGQPAAARRVQVAQ